MVYPAQAQSLRAIIHNQSTSTLPYLVPFEEQSTRLLNILETFFINAASIERTVFAQFPSLSRFAVIILFDENRSEEILEDTIHRKALIEKAHRYHEAHKLDKDYPLKIRIHLLNYAQRRLEEKTGQTALHLLASGDPTKPDTLVFTIRRWFELACEKDSKQKVEEWMKDLKQPDDNLMRLVMFNLLRPVRMSNPSTLASLKTDQKVTALDEKVKSYFWSHLSRLTYDQLEKRFREAFPNGFESKDIHTTPEKKELALRYYFERVIVFCERLRKKYFWDSIGQELIIPTLSNQSDILLSLGRLKAQTYSLKIKGVYGSPPTPGQLQAPATPNKSSILNLFSPSKKDKVDESPGLTIYLPSPIWSEFANDWMILGETITTLVQLLSTKPLTPIPSPGMKIPVRTDSKRNLRDGMSSPKGSSVHSPGRDLQAPAGPYNAFSPRLLLFSTSPRDMSLSPPTSPRNFAVLSPRGHGTKVNTPVLRERDGFSSTPGSKIGTPTSKEREGILSNPGSRIGTPIERERDATSSTPGLRIGNSTEREREGSTSAPGSKIVTSMSHEGLSIQSTRPIYIPPMRQLHSPASPGSSPRGSFLNVRGGEFTPRTAEINSMQSPVIESESMFHNLTTSTVALDQLREIHDIFKSEIKFLNSKKTTSELPPSLNSERVTTDRLMPIVDTKNVMAMVCRGYLHELLYYLELHIEALIALDDTKKPHPFVTRYLEYLEAVELEKYEKEVKPRLEAHKKVFDEEYLRKYGRFKDDYINLWAWEAWKFLKELNATSLNKSERAMHLYLEYLKKEDPKLFETNIKGLLERKRKAFEEKTPKLKGESDRSYAQRWAEHAWQFLKDAEDGNQDQFKQFEEPRYQAFGEVGGKYTIPLLEDGLDKPIARRALRVILNSIDDENKDLDGLLEKLLHTLNTCSMREGIQIQLGASNRDPVSNSNSPEGIFWNMFFGFVKHQAQKTKVRAKPGTVIPTEDNKWISLDKYIDILGRIRELDKSIEISLPQVPNESTNYRSCRNFDTIRAKIKAIHQSFIRKMQNITLIDDKEYTENWHTWVHTPTNANEVSARMQQSILSQNVKNCINRLQEDLRTLTQREELIQIAYIIGDIGRTLISLPLPQSSGSMV